MKNRWFLALLTAVLFIISACGNNTGSNSNEGTNNGGTKAKQLAKISLFQSKVEIAESLENLASKYKQETGNEVEVWGSAGDSYITQLQTKLAANEGPTIFFLSNKVLKRKSLHPISMI